MLKKVLLSLLVGAFLLGTLGCAVIVKTGEEGALTGEVNFSAGDNVAEIWDSQAVPALEEQAVDIATFLEESNGDFKSLADKYGKYSMGDSGELSYTLKGEGTVTEIVTDKSAGYIVVKPSGYDGNIVLKMQIGKVFKGSAIRDSIPFIKFGDYKNQQDYAAVSQSIHDVVQNTVIDPIDIASLKGKDIAFCGCFTVNKDDEILLTPINITVL